MMKGLTEIEMELVVNGEKFGRGGIPYGMSLYIQS